MSKYVDKIIRSIKDNPVGWSVMPSRYTYIYNRMWQNGGIQRDGIALEADAGGIRIFIEKIEVPTTWMDRIRVRFAITRWYRAQFTVEV